MNGANDHRLSRVAILVWIAILLAISGRIVFSARNNSVYPIFATAGEHWRDGEPVYSEPTPDLDQFRYSPLVAAWFSWWSILPRTVGEFVWRALNAVVLLGGVAVWANWRRTPADVGWMLLLIVPLAVGGLNNGQCNALIAGLLLFAQVWLDRERYWAAAIAIAICVLLKEYPIALGLLFCVIEPRRFTPRFAICILAGLALPYLMAPASYVTEQYTAWFARVSGDDRTSYGLAVSYRDLQMLLRVCGIPLTLVQYRLLETLLAIAAAGFVWVNREKWPRSHAIAACGAMATCWMTLAGPATESSTLVLAAPLLAEMMIDSMNQTHWRRRVTLASYALLTVGAMIVWFPREIAKPVHSTAIQPLGLLLLTIAAISAYRSAPNRRATEQQLSPLPGWPRCQPPWRLAASESSRK